MFDHSLTNMIKLKFKNNGLRFYCSQLFPFGQSLRQSLFEMCGMRRIQMHIRVENAELNNEPSAL